MEDQIQQDDRQVSTEDSREVHKENDAMYKGACHPRMQGIDLGEPLVVWLKVTLLLMVVIEVERQRVARPSH